MCLCKTTQVTGSQDPDGPELIAKAFTLGLLYLHSHLGASHWVAKHIGTDDAHFLLCSWSLTTHQVFASFLPIVGKAEYMRVTGTVIVMAKIPTVHSSIESKF